MGVHTHSGACGGNVTVPTFIHLCFAPTLMWMGFSMNSPILGGSADVIGVASTSISSCLVSNLVGVGVCVGVVVLVGVVAVLTYLSSCGNSPAPTSLHVCSNAAHPLATNW